MTIIVCFLCLNSIAQDANEQITADINQYFQLLQEEKISEALDWVHPDLIGMVGKEMFLAQYNEMLKKASFGELTITSISEVFNSSSKGEFALVNYAFQMNYDVADMDASAKQIMLNSMKSTFGDAELDGDLVKVKANREMFAVSKPEFEGWRILDYEVGMRPMLIGIISEEVLNHFGK